MKIAILSRNAKLYSSRRLAEAARQRNHEVRVIDPLHCYMNITSHRPSIHYKGQVIEGYDAVIPRIGASVTFYGTAVLRQFEMMGVFPLNESVAITRARDKLRSLQLLSRKGIGLPVTGFAHSPDDIKDMIDIAGGAPLVIKLLEGTQGIGVVLAETRKAAESVIEAFMGLRANILVQELWIDPALGIPTENNEQWGLLHMRPADEIVSGMLSYLLEHSLILHDDKAPRLSVAGRGRAATGF